MRRARLFRQGNYAAHFMSETGSPSFQTDKRHYSRRPITANVELNGSSIGVIVDASENGLKIQSVQNLNTGSSVTARFHLPRDSSCIKVKGRIAWTNTSAKLAGMEFSSLSEEARQLLRELLCEPSSSASGNAGFDTPERENIHTINSEKASYEIKQNQANETAREIILPDSSFRVAAPRAAARANYWKLVDYAAVLCLVVAVSVWAVRSVNSSSVLRSVSTKYDRTQSTITVHESMPSVPAMPSELPHPEPAEKPASPASDALPAPTSLDRPGIVLQAAAMSHKQNATDLVASLETKQFPAFVYQRGGLCLVFVGPYSADSAKAVKDAMAKQGIATIPKPWTP